MERRLSQIMQRQAVRRNPRNPTGRTRHIRLHLLPVQRCQRGDERHSSSRHGRRDIKAAGTTPAWSDTIGIRLTATSMDRSMIHVVAPCTVDLERSAQCVVMAHLHGHGRGRNWGVSNPKRCCLPWSCSRAGAACVWSRRRTDSCEKKIQKRIKPKAT